jgi:hypothetical protein
MESVRSEKRVKFTHCSEDDVKIQSCPYVDITDESMSTVQNGCNQVIAPEQFRDHVRRFVSTNEDRRQRQQSIVREIERFLAEMVSVNDE